MIFAVEFKLSTLKLLIVKIPKSDKNSKNSNILFDIPYDAKSWAGLGYVLISKELDKIKT
jgi:hypothetical protein